MTKARSDAVCRALVSQQGLSRVLANIGPSWCSPPPLFVVVVIVVTPETMLWHCKKHLSLCVSLCLSLFVCLSVCLSVS